MIYEENGQIIVDDLRNMSKFQPYKKLLLFNVKKKNDFEFTLIQDKNNWMDSISNIPAKGW